MKSLIALLFPALVFAQGTAVPVNTWTHIAAGGYPASIPGYDKVVYVPELKMGVDWGDFHSSYSEQNMCLVGYSYIENRWNILDCGGMYHTEHLPDGGHPAGIFAYDPLRHSINWAAGASGSNEAEPIFHHFWWDVLGLTGRDKNYTPRIMTGSVTATSSSAWDAFHDKMVIFPDASGHTGIYDPNTNTTSTITGGASAPGSMIWHSMAYNSVDHKVYLFFGATGTGCSLTFNNTVYRFDAGSNTWESLTTTGGPPAGRVYAGVAYSTVDNIFLVAGGSNCTGGGAGDTDSWTFNPATLTWTQLSPATNFTLVDPSYFPQERLWYDSDSNVFLMILRGNGTTADYTGGTGTPAPAAIWAYCYSGCANYGRAGSTYAIPSGSWNKNTSGSSSQSFATGLSLASNGSTLYAGIVETSATWSFASGYERHPYVRSTTDGVTFTSLGSNYLAMDSEASGSDVASNLQLAMVGSTLWASWEKSNNSGSMPSRLYAKSWNGSLWSGGAIGTATAATNVYQGISRIVGVGSVPTIAFLELDKDANTCGGRNPPQYYLYVKQYSGGTWSTLGTALNRQPACNGGTSGGTRAESVALTSDGTVPIVCFTESGIPNDLSISPTPQMYCSKWNGSSWTAMGGSLNRTASNWASDAEAAYHLGQPYVAWTERTASGNTKLYVATTANGSTWTIVGAGALNKDTTNGWAVRPRLASDGAANLYLMWEESTNLAVPNRVYGMVWNGSTWSAMGSTPMMDTTNGSAANLALTMFKGSPVALWGEQTTGNLRQAYAKVYNISSGVWGTMGGATPVCSISPTSIGPYIAGTVVSQAFTTVGCSSSTWNASGLTGSGLSINSGTGILSGTAVAGTYNVTITYDTASQPMQIVITPPALPLALIGSTATQLVVRYTAPSPAPCTVGAINNNDGSAVNDLDTAKFGSHANQDIERTAANGFKWPAMVSSDGCDRLITIGGYQETKTGIDSKPYTTDLAVNAPYTISVNCGAVSGSLVAATAKTGVPPLQATGNAKMRGAAAGR